MKSILTIVLVSIFFSNGILFAQDQLPVEQTANYGKDGKLYVNKDLGIYLWLSTSPDEGAEKIRLMSDSTKKYANPMYLDTEGYNTFRSPSAVDTVTKRMAWPKHDIIFEVYSDSRSPFTKAKTEGILNGTKEEHKVYQNEVKITLSARDAMSGTENIYYSLDGASYTIYKEAFSVKKNGIHQVKYYGTDKVGNREEAKTLEFYIEANSSE